MAEWASEAVTRGIHVQVKVRFDPERSHPGQGLWFFPYTIRITNRGTERVQLLSRHWIINDAHGRTEEVRGPGVVGEQPVLGPGDAFEYTSGCPMATPFGSMEGTYRMAGPGGEQFDVRIAPFALTDPQSIH